MRIYSSRHLRCPYSLPAMQLFKYRVPADDAEISHARTRRRALRAENYSEGILLSRLPLYMDKPGRAFDRTPLASVLSWKRSRTGLKRRAIKHSTVEALKRDHGAVT